MGGGWWRRNRWGVAALVPMLALALALPVYDGYTDYWTKAPRTPVAAGSDGWVAFAKAKLRLTAINPETGLTDGAGDPVTLPADMRAWSATIRFSASNPLALGGCDVALTDTSGDTYASDPSELTDLGADVDITDCAPDSDSGSTVTSWTDVFYFVTPAGVKPAGVRVAMDAQLPRYAWLTPSTG
jgi:hypothetical protein